MTSNLELQAEQRPTRRVRGIVAALLALAVLVTFGGARDCDFTLADDPHYVLLNPWVRGGISWEGVRWAFTSGHAANWHPLTWLSHMLDVEWFGLEPAGHHATSVVLHAVSAVLCLFALERLTRRFWPSAAVALLFALHPLRVESVAWVSERKDVLCACFFFAILLAHARHAEQPSRARLAWVLVLLALGLLAKPMLVTVPFLLLVLEGWPLGRARELGWRRLALEKIPLFALVALSSVVTFLVQSRGGAVQSVEAVPISVRLLHAASACLTYLRQLVWPANLCVYYPYPREGQALNFGLALAALGGITWMVLRERTRRAYLLTGWLWFLGMLVPVIGIVQVGSQAHADRYTYLPSVGITLALVWLAADLLCKAPRWCAPALTLAAAALLALQSHALVRTWKDSTTLFERALAVGEESALIHQSLGQVLAERGELEPAIVHLRRSVELQPDFAAAHGGLGAALLTRGELEGAATHLQRAIELDPRDAVPHCNLGLLLEKRGDLDGALAAYQATTALDPWNSTAHAHAAKLLGMRGKLDEALASYRAARVIASEDLELVRFTAVTLTLLGRVEEAIAEYELLLRLSPDDVDALNNVAWIRATHPDARMRNGADAVRRAERARDLLRASPNPIVLDTLAAALAEAGRFPEAVAACESAIALAEGTGDPRGAARFREHLELFRNARPLRLR